MKIDCIVHGRSSLRCFHPALAATADAKHEGSEKPMQERGLMQKRKPKKKKKTKTKTKTKHNKKYIYNIM
jgi:hypothetical protein